MTEFKTEPVFEALKSPLALVDDADRRQAFERYVEAARLPLERAVFDLLAACVEAVDEQVSDHYRARLAYRAGSLALDVERREADRPQSAAETDWATDGEQEKVTIRLPAELKELVTEAAAGAGVSVNAWFIRAVAGSLRGRRHDREEEREHRHERRERGERPGHGSRLSGWIGLDE